MTPVAARIRSAGQGLLNAHEVALPATLRLGTHPIVAGVYDPADMTRWRIVAADRARVSADRYALAAWRSIEAKAAMLARLTL